MLVSFVQLLAAASVAASSGLPFQVPRFPLAGGMNQDSAKVASPPSGTYPAEFIQIPVDHFNESDTRTYANRYWVNSKYYKPGGPIFLFDAGEQNAEGLVDHYLYESAGPSAPMSLARRFNGLGLLWEHRYYGGATADGHANGSYPSPVDKTGMAADYTYLTNEQALEDVVYLAHNFKPQGLEDCEDQLGPEKTPWVFVGGSYPGMRAAFIRQRNPETFFASWASSAPVQATIDYWTYYSPAEKSMTRNCSADYTAVTRYVDNILANGTASEISDLKYEVLVAANSGPGWGNEATVSRNDSDALQNADIGNYLLTPTNFYQAYGFEGSVLPFCDIMETFNQTTVSTTDNGGTAPAIASESGVAITHDVATAFKWFLAAMSELGYNNLPGGASEGPSSGLSWMWQYCTEFAFYQVGNPENPHTIQSQFVDIDYFQGQCNSTFVNQTSYVYTPDVAKILKYGGWNMNPSNVMFTNGEYDPWRSLSPGSSDTVIGAPNRQPVQFVPKCNVAPDNGTYFGQVYTNMVHASDMRARLVDPVGNFSSVGFYSHTSPESFYSGVGLFGEALQQWLPCFGQN